MYTKYKNTYIDKEVMDEVRTFWSNEKVHMCMC
jgi:hypothetical protein